MNETRATRYQRLKRRAGVAGLLSAGTVLAVVALSPASGWLASFANRLAGADDWLHGTLALAVYCLLLVVLWEAAALPAVLSLELGAGRKYRPEHGGTVEDVVGALIPTAVVAVLAAFAAGLAVRVAVVLAGPWWWVMAGALASAGLALALHASPAVMTRLAAAQRLSRPSLVARLEGLIERSRVPVAGILEWQVDRASPMTAVVAGAGRSRRVFVASTIVRDWTDDEIAVVVAHELAHHKYLDLWRTWALDAALLCGALGIADLALRLAPPGSVGESPAALATLPFLALVAGLVWVAATPLRHAQSRRHERRADIFALAITDGAEAFGTAIRRLGDRHLAEERPAPLTRWLHYRHPSVAERLAIAAAYVRVKDVRTSTLR